MKREASELSVDDRGHILVPLAVRRQLGLSPGMILVVEQAEDQSLRLRVQAEPEIMDEGGVLVVRGEIQADLANLVRDEREARHLELLQRIGL